jgi:hypothetical protein
MFNVEYLVMAIHRLYRNRRDFEKIVRFFEIFFANGKTSVPLKGTLVIGC